MDTRQQAMLKEMGIRLPWPAPVSATPLVAALPQEAQPQQARTTPEQLSVQSSTPEATQKLAPPPSRIKEQLTAAPVQKKPVDEIHSESAGANTQHFQTRAAKIAQLAWSELETAAHQCDACVLCKSRKQAVFSAGDPTAQWMIVGEAPGEQEDKQGFPFVGPAGQLLDRMLAQLNLSRAPTENQQSVYIANVLKCRPPRNRNPEPAEMAVCEHFLKRQIELVQPKVILVVGRFAVQTLLETHEAIGRLRGQVHDYKGIPAIVTYHPAYLLRNPVDKRKSWADLCLAAQTFSA